VKEAKMSEKKPEIKVNDLKEQRPAGSEFLNEEEGYLDNLSEEELNARGGADDISISAGDYISSGTYTSTGPGSDVSIGDLD
jgi:hypothetical protein